MSLFYEDFTVGQVFAGGGRTIPEAEMIQFAHIYDPQNMHLDRLHAEEGPFHGLIASGFHTICLAWWLFLQLGLVHDSMWVGIGIDALRWHRPVRPGDTVSLQVKIVDKSPSSAPDRGRVTFSHTLTNQNGEVVMTYHSLNLIYCKVAP
jgi:acyl dehydratase